MEQEGFGPLFFLNTSNHIRFQTMPYKPPVKDCIDCGCALKKPEKGAYSYGRRCRECYGQNIYKKRARLKTQSVEYKGGCCADCGGVFHQCQYDFHHIDEDRNNNKDKTIGHMTHGCRPWKVIQEELDKCVMLCANCHRLRHFEESVDRYL